MKNVRSKAVVIGLGNPLMTDEGIGLEIVRELAASSNHSSSTDFVEASSLMSVVHAIAGRSKAVIIDCAKMGESPGSIIRFSPDEAKSTKNMSCFSLHEGDLLDALKLSHTLGEYPGEVIIFGIQPENITQGYGISRSLQQRLKEYVLMIDKELQILQIQ